MYKQLFRIILCLGLMNFAGLASAMPMVDFDVDGPGSSVTSTKTLGFGSISTALVAGLDNEMFSLAEGGMKTFDFFTISVSRGSLLTADISATLAFDKPAGVAVGNGTGGFSNLVTIFGSLRGGILKWNNMPVIVSLVDGTKFGVAFSDIPLTGGVTEFLVTATVKLLKAGGNGQVPEPGILLLMASGLMLLFLGVRRDRSRSGAVAA